VLTVLLGTLIGIARLSRNWLVARLSALYIEVFQDIPVLLQLFFWYAFFTEILPSPRQAIHPFTGVFLSNRGLVFGVPAPHPCHVWMIAALAAGFGAALLLWRYAKLRQASSGKALPVLRTAMALVGAGPLAVWLLSGAPREMILPELVGFNFRSGIAVSPEFSALLLGLVLYTAAFVAEIVRAGIQAVSRGQGEAALSLGLKTSQTLHLVILPQALRVIIPPLTSQMLNLTKNSSLAVAIGYPDFVSVAGTAINQTGQAIEGVALIMSAYLFLSLLTSAFMNWYNRKMALVER
jgi:general L-amino acid transport system permease protein